MVEQPEERYLFCNKHQQRYREGLGVCPICDGIIIGAKLENKWAAMGLRGETKVLKNMCYNVIERVEGARRARKLKRRAALRTADEKRRDLDAEIADLMGKLG